jgi:hypothetical protein
MGNLKAQSLEKGIVSYSSRRLFRTTEDHGNTNYKKKKNACTSRAAIVSQLDNTPETYVLNA